MAGFEFAEQSDGTETDRAGRVVVEPDLTVKGHPYVFVVGDLMAVPGVPGMAQGAIQGANYATKLIITKPGPLPNAGLVRFIVLDGRERERVELPLPLTLERGVDYRVKVSVHGSRFLTSVNGQLVSSWTDNRLSRGDAAEGPDAHRLNPIFVAAGQIAVVQRHDGLRRARGDDLLGERRGADAALSRVPKPLRPDAVHDHRDLRRVRAVPSAGASDGGIAVRLSRTTASHS